MKKNLKLQAAGIQQDYAVAIALPLHSDGISGVLTIYSKQANAFDVAEVELLEELAETLSYGLMTLRARNLLKQTNEQLHREISDRKQAEAALQESYNLLRTVINASSDHIFVKDRQGCYKLINASGASLFNKLFLNQAEFEKLQCRPVTVNLVAFLNELIDERQATIGDKPHLMFSSIGENEQFLGDAKLREHPSLADIPEQAKYNKDIQANSRG